MKRTSLIMSILFFAVGCAGQQVGPEKKLKSWEGRQASELSAKWGYPPDELLREGDKMIYKYRRSVAAATSIRGSVGGYDTECIVSFEVKNELILGVRFEGDESCLDSLPADAY